MKYLAIIIAATGVVSILISVGLEIALGEPIYMLFVKIGACVFGVGGMIGLIAKYK